MITGDVLRLRSLKAIRRDDAKMRSEVSYAAPKGKDFVVMLLGAVEHAQPSDALETFARETLERLGWIAVDREEIERIATELDEFGLDNKAATMRGWLASPTTQVDG